MNSVVRVANCCLALIMLGPSIVEPGLRAQSPSVLQFETVSIKRSDPDADSGWLRSEPDGTFVEENASIRQIIFLGSPEPAREVVGLPDWAMRERYVIRAKPPAGATAEQKAMMWRSLFAGPMKLAAHVEREERDTYALVIASADGHLGPHLTPSTIDCDPRGAAQRSLEARARCGGPEGVGPLGGWIRSPGMPIEALALYLSGMVGGRVVNDRTGLQGLYNVDFSWSRAPAEVNPRAVHEQAIFSATEEQLGLKLLAERSPVSILVIDHIERPTSD
jgi:uncharacterized protein (TIGR03435 family)